jgi:hypothetical protein
VLEFMKSVSKQQVRQNHRAAADSSAPVQARALHTMRLPGD